MKYSMQSFIITALAPLVFSLVDDPVFDAIFGADPISDNP
jgi:hypothetical protein